MHLHVNRTWRLVILMCIPVCLAGIDSLGVSAFLPKLILEIGLPLDQAGAQVATWVVTAYLIATSIAVFTMGPLSDRIGWRKTFLLCLVLYIAGSLLIVFYPVVASLLSDLYNAAGIQVDAGHINLHAIIIARVLAAFGGGALTAIAISIVAGIFAPEKRALPLGLIGTADTLGWLAGGTLSGLIVQTMHWSAIFLLVLPVIFVSMVGLWFALNEVKQERTSERFDWIGFGLIALLLTLLNLGLTSIQVSDSVPAILAAAILLVLFVLWEQRTPSPLIDIRIFRLPGVAVAILLNLVVGFVLLVSLVSLPLVANAREVNQWSVFAALNYFQDLAFQQAALISGILLGAIVIPLALASTWSSNLLTHIGFAKTTRLGLIIGVIGLAGNYLALRVTDSYELIGVFSILVGTGIGLTFTPLITVVLNAVQETRRGTASALILSMRMVGMSIATSIGSVYIYQRTIELVTSIETPPLDIPQEIYHLVFPTAYVQSVNHSVSELDLLSLGLFLTALLITFRFGFTTPPTLTLPQ